LTALRKFLIIYQRQELKKLRDELLPMRYLVCGKSLTDGKMKIILLLRLILFSKNRGDGYE